MEENCNMTEIEDYISDVKDEVKDNVKSDDIEISLKTGVAEKQESLAILASLGTTKEYLGADMSLGDIKKLSVKDVEKYYNRYQAVLGKKISGGLLDSSLQLVSQVISYIVPVDDIEALCLDLKNDDLVNRELTNIVGLLALKAGRLAALASGLFQVAKHVKFKTQRAPEDPEGIQQVASTTEHKNQEISSTTEQSTKQDASRV